MLNREVFQTDPSSYRIPNDGVAKIIFPPSAGAPTQTDASKNLWLRRGLI